MNNYQNKKYSIAFWGTPEISARILKKLNNNYPESIQLVITSPNKPANRKIIEESPVKKTALSLGLKIIQPSVLNNEFIEKFKERKYDISIIVAYGKIIPSPIINIPRNGTINIHFSALPKYRGASPIQTAILNNEIETAATIIRIDEKMDHGNIIDSVKIKIEKKETAQSLNEK